jgi:hypothetical protein
MKVQAMMILGGEGGVRYSLGGRCRRVVTLMLRPVYLREISLLAIELEGWVVSRPGLDVFWE